MQPPKFSDRWGVEELAVPRGALLTVQGADPSTPELLLEPAVGRSGALSHCMTPGAGLPW